MLGFKHFISTPHLEDNLARVVILNLELDKLHVVNVGLQRAEKAWANF